MLKGRHVELWSTERGCLICMMVPFALSHGTFHIMVANGDKNGLRINESPASRIIMDNRPWTSLGGRYQ